VTEIFEIGFKSSNLHDVGPFAVRNASSLELPG
jgi:hypothetical protein